MTPHDDKRRQRQLKREIKRSGNKRRRRHLKKELEHHPEEAAHHDYEFDHDSSTGFNGMDRDATRRKNEEEE